MRSLITFLLLITLAASAIQAQHPFTSDKIEWAIELPSPVWKVISEPDAVHEHTEFVYGDRMDGYLQIRKESVDPGMTLAELARHDQEQKLRYLPGFVEGKEEKFTGRLTGLTATYEFVKTGKPMMGRIYYLQVDPRTVYTLRFTGLREKLARIRNQTDLIARSFRLK